MNSLKWVPFDDRQGAARTGARRQRIRFGSPALAPFILTLLASLTAPGPAAGQCPFDWRPGEGVSGVNGQVNATTTWDPDGAGPQPELLIVGGSFTVAGDVVANNIAAWDGATWKPLGAGMNDTVYALSVYNGELIAGGTFTTAGGAANYIARWNGATWQPLGTGMNYYVRALMVYNSELIAGGFFNTAGGVNVNYVAHWNGATWQALGTGMNSNVRALAVYNGELVAGGEFLTAGGVKGVNRIARWNGASWQPLGTGMDYTVRALTVYDGELIAGGDFSTAGGVSANRIARWNGATWQPLGTGMSYWVYALTVYNGELIAGGYFWTAGGVSANRIARWNGATWQPLGTGMDDTVYTLTVYNGELIAGGYFTTAGGVGASRIARWNGATWQLLGTGMNSDVRALAVYNGELIAGGWFTSAGGESASHIARWNGASWQPLGTGMNNHVDALTVYNGELIAGGWFTSAGGASANRIACWNGANWQPLGTGMSGGSSYPYVSALTVYNGELIAGGYFWSAGGAFINDIARWNGATWQPLGTGIDGTVYALTVYDGELIAGGNFYTAGDASVNYIARWNGATWQPLGTGMNWYVCALTVYNGELIAGGDFLTAGGASANYVARWDGATWQPLGTGIDGTVYALTVYNGELIAGGEFSIAGGVSANYIARWNGATWQPLGTGMSSPVLALTVYNGELIAGGVFTTAGGNVSAYWARWEPGPGACCIPAVTTDCGWRPPECRVMSPADCAALGGGFLGCGAPCEQQILVPIHTATEWSHRIMRVSICALSPRGQPPCVTGPARIDPWVSSEGTGANCEDFGHPNACPVPGGFFGPGSDPFAGTVCFRGQPVGAVILEGFPDPLDFGEHDTLVRRTQDPFERCELPSAQERAVPIVVERLNLRSCDPITITFNGGANPQQWDVQVVVTGTAGQPGGTLTATKEHCNGGIFRSTLAVCPRFIFTLVGNPGTVLELDYCTACNPGGIVMQAEGVPWVHDVGQNVSLVSPVCSQFHPGVSEAAPLTQCDCNQNGARDKCDIETGFSRDCNANDTPDECDPQRLDVALFVDQLLGVAQDPSDACLFDLTGNGALDGADIQGFIERLLGN